MDAIARTETAIMQLCCLELPSELVIPAVLKQLRAVVPSGGSTFFWCGQDYQVSNLYDDPFESPEVVAFYLQEFYNRPERELHAGFAYAFQHYQGALDFGRILSVDRRTYLNSDFYNLVLRPLNYADSLHLVVRALGRPLGDLAVWRSLNDVAFTTREKRCLECLEPFIAHAAEASKKLGESQVTLVDEDEDTGLVIVNRAGKIQHISPQARKLLFLATNPQIMAKTTHGEVLRLPTEIIQMCWNLIAIFEGKQDNVAPPVYEHHSPWGRFVFRAYWLDNGNPLDSLIGITIKHQVPLPVRVIGQLKRFRLSRRQMQICALLASGYSDANIAHAMNMTINTVITHNRRIYNKLNVHSRAELVNKLLEYQSANLN
jgi:DNA-binding CsgD family transcriptional regulator